MNEVKGLLGAPQFSLSFDVRRLGGQHFPLRSAEVRQAEEVALRPHEFPDRDVLLDDLAR